MSEESPGEGSALAALRELLAIYDRHPEARAYLEGSEHAWPKVVARARKLLQAADLELARRRRMPAP